MENSFNSTIVSLVLRTIDKIMEKPEGSTVLKFSILDAAYAHIDAPGYPEKTMVSGKMEVCGKGEDGLWTHFSTCNKDDELVEGKFRVVLFRPFMTNKLKHGFRDKFVVIMKERVYKEFIDNEGTFRM